MPGLWRTGNHGLSGRGCGVCGPGNTDQPPKVLSGCIRLFNGTYLEEKGVSDMNILVEESTDCYNDWSSRWEKYDEIRGGNLTRMGI